MANYIPIKNLVIANTKIVKTIFGVNISAEKFKKCKDAGKPYNFICNGKTILINGDKKGELVEHDIKYPCKLRVFEDPLLNLTTAERDYLNTPPNLFDRLIFTALSSLYREGIKEISVTALYRLINGKSNHNCKPSPKHAAEILASVKKLACLQVHLDLSDAFTNYRTKYGKFKYNDGKPLVINFTPIIHCSIFRGAFQTKDEVVTIIKLNAESPLFKAARLLNQLVTVPCETLDVGNIRHTLNVYSVKFYTLIRVTERLGTAITFEDIFDNCAISDANSVVLIKARDIIFAVLENLQTSDILKSFEIIRQGRTFVKIQLVYSTKSTHRKKTLD